MTNYKLKQVVASEYNHSLPTQSIKWRKGVVSVTSLKYSSFKDNFYLILLLQFYLNMAGR